MPMMDSPQREPVSDYKKARSLTELVERIEGVEARLEKLETVSKKTNKEPKYDKSADKGTE